MRLGIIAPAAMLETYCITKTHYVLPSLFLENETYRNFYLEASKKGHLIILDSKQVGWKRAPASIEMILECLQQITPRYIITPSYLFKTKDSLEVTKQFLSLPQIKGLNPETTRVVGCVEGTTEEECLNYKKELRQLGLNLFAYPSHIYNTYKGPKGIYIENHSRLEELQGCEGILVTSLPIRLGLKGMLIPDYFPTPGSLDFNTVEDPFPGIIKKNLQKAVKFCKDQEAARKKDQEAARKKDQEAARK